MASLLIALLAGASASLVIWAVWILNREVVTSGEDSFGTEVEEVDRTAVRLMMPYARAAGAVFQRLIPDEADLKPGHQPPPLLQLKRFLSKQLRYAGNPGGIQAEEFVGLMAVGGGGAALAWVLLALLLALPSWWIPVTALAAVLGFALPAIWLKDVLQARRKAIRKTLPYAMDLLTLSVEAGLDFTVALGRIVQKIGRGPMGVELGRTLKEIQMGTPRKAALRDFGDRMGMLEVSFLTAALIQADELGSSLGPILRIQGEQLRQRRFMAAEELALKAPVKMIFPLAIFILPITLMVILGPLLIKFIPMISGAVSQQTHVGRIR